MKPASEWALEFLNKHIVNTRECGEVERFVKAVQDDARRGLKPSDSTGLEFEND